MHRLWHQLLRKFRLLSRWEQVASVAMALLGLGAIGWVTWTELATSTPPSISMTTLVEDARKEGVKIYVLCPFVNAERRKHPDWADVFQN